MTVLLLLWWFFFFVKSILSSFDVHLTVNTVKSAVTAAAPHQPTHPGDHDVQHWACSKEKIQEEVKKRREKKKQNQRVKNDICCCWATSSPPGNDLGFQVSKSEDRLGRVRQTLKGAITTVEKGRVTKRTEKRKKNSSDIIRGLGLESKMDEEQSDYPHRDRLLWQVEMTWCCGFKRWHRPRVFSCL